MALITTTYYFKDEKIKVAIVLT